MSLKKSIALTISLFLLVNMTIAGNKNFSQKELAYMPAFKQIELYEKGIISPVDVLKAQIELFRQTNKTINAVTYTHFTSALLAAKNSEKRYKNKTNRSLEGISVGVKDEHYDQGWCVTQGSLIYLNSPVQKESDPIVTKLKNAGAILSLQTTVPEFYVNYATNSKAWGITTNPWNVKYTPGGSSGGSGAALAAGYVTLATGSDMGGSIRIPSSLNGLYGLKPAFGVVYTDLPLSYFSGSGPMARDFRDVILMYNVIKGSSEYSMNVINEPVSPVEYKNIKGMKVAYIGGMGILEPSDETKKAMKSVLVK